MLDLAPFVAAVLKDKVMHDLQEEVKLLRDKNRALSSIEVTGQNGQMIYARGSLDSGECGPEETRWLVPVKQVQQMSWQDIIEMEIWIGGSRRENTCTEFTHRLRTENNGTRLAISLDVDSCCIVIKTEWSPLDSEDPVLPEIIARRGSHGLFEYISTYDAKSRRYHITGISIPIKGNEKLITAIDGPHLEKEAMLCVGEFIRLSKKKKIM